MYKKFGFKNHEIGDSVWGGEAWHKMDIVLDWWISHDWTNIFADADACPVVGIVEKVAKEHNLPVTLLCDTNHVLSSDYSEVIVVGAGADAVDYKLISICHKGDIVV